VLRAPELDAGLQVGSRQSRAEQRGRITSLMTFLLQTIQMTNCCLLEGRELKSFKVQKQKIKLNESPQNMLKIIFYFFIILLYAFFPNLVIYTDLNKH